jgi:hypothetical protein
MCGNRVPEKRRKATGKDKPAGKGKSNYAHLFCSDACFTKYADQMIGMARESELEVQEDIKQEIRSGQGPWSELLANLDEAAATATANAERPQEIAARFLGAFAGKFAGKMATKAYTSFVDGVKTWSKAKEQETAKEQAQNEQQKPGAQKPQAPKPPGQAPAGKPPTAPGAPQSPSQPSSSQPGQGQPGARPAGPQQQKPSPKPTTPNSPGANTPGSPTPPSTPPPQAPKREWKNVKEPEDLEDRSLEEQRVWLLRRFYLPPSATREELEAKYKAVMRRFHPDNRLTGDPKIATIVNATKQRLDEIERELTPKKRRR